MTGHRGAPATMERQLHNYTNGSEDDGASSILLRFCYISRGGVGGGMVKNKSQTLEVGAIATSLGCCLTRIRTWTEGTKNLSATITP